MRLFFIILSFLPAFLMAQTDSISTLLQSKLSNKGKHQLHSILYYLEKQQEDFVYHQAFGVDQKNGVPITKDASFRIASITKPFVATIVLQLAEEGKLQLEDRVFDYLAETDFLDLANFHFYEGEAGAHKMSIQHLLAHRSGLADIFNDKGNRFYLSAFLHKKRQYSPRLIVDKYFKYKLNKQAHFPVGTNFFYSDMNYVLLGLLIEQIEGMPLAQVIRTRILEPLKMEHTYFEFYETVTAPEQRVHQYVKRLDMTKMNSSFDWAGGGLVSTTSDLAIFIKALFNGQLLSTASLNKMTDMQFTKEHHNRYGLGLYESTYNGDTYYGHYGFYGCYMGYSPESKTVLVYNLSQSKTDFYPSIMVDETLKIKQ